MLSRNALLWINRLVWTLLAGAVILLGSIVSLGRYFVPSIESHQREIVAEINHRTGLQISVGRLGGSWKRLSPYFVVDDLRLHDPRDPSRVVLRVAHAEIQLGIFRSIAGGTIAISRLRGNDVHLELEETELGKWRLAGFGGEGRVELDRVIDFVAAIYRAELTGSTLDLHFFGGGAAHLSGPALRLQRAGDFRRLNLEVQVSGGDRRGEIAAPRGGNEPLRVVIETQGDPRRLGEVAGRGQFSARGYGEFRGVDLTPVLPAAKAFGIDLEHGRVDGAAWFEWRAGGAIEWRGHAAIPQFDVVGVSKLELEPIKNIKTQFLIRDYPHGHRDQGRRQFWLPELSGNWHGVDLKFPRLSATVDSALPQRVLVAMPELPLSPLREAALADGNLSQPLRDVLTALSPQGELRNVHIDLPLRADRLDSWRLRAQLHGVSVQPWQGAPGVTGLSGYIDSGARSGRAELSSEDFSIAFPHVYREPLHFAAVRGQVGWRIEDDRALIDSGPIVTQSDAGAATAQVSLDLPFDHRATPLMTLQIGLQNSAAQYRDRFIPYTLRPSLLQWLQQSIGKGDIPIGGFIYRGSLRAGDQLNNTVQLFLHAHNAELKYQPEWPALHDIRAGVWVDDTLLRVDVKRARIYQRIALRDGEVNLRPDGDTSWLTVDTRADADNDDVLRLLRETPIRKQIGAAFDRWRWRGPTQSQVHLGIPLGGTQAGSDARPLDIKVDSHLNGGALDMLDQNIVLDDVRGDLTYRSDSVARGASAAAQTAGLRAENLKAKWFGKPVAIEVTTAADNAISVGARGQIAMIDLQQWLRQPLFAFTGGEVAFDATLRIAGGAAALQVESNLQGATIDLPPPYRKAAEQALPLALTLNMGAEPDLTVTLSDWADMRLRWRRADTGAMQLSAGVVRLGRHGKADVHDGQLIVTGAVASTDLSDWSAALRARPPASGEESGDIDGVAVHIRELQFGDARVGGHTVNDLTVSGRRDSAAWSVQIRAEQIAGVLTLPDAADQPWRAQLNYLRLPVPAAHTLTRDATADPAPQNSETDNSPIAQIDPRHIFALDLRIERLWRGEENLGWVETRLRPIENGLRLDDLKGELRGVKIEARERQPAHLLWLRENGGDRSEFFGRLAVDDVAQALQRWRYEPVLTSKRGHADVAAQWPGRPDQFQFAQADANAALRFDDGQFTRASNSATGALKVVGIFNFANFLRRLQFNFADIYKEGLSFDEMQGAFKTQRGVLTLTEPVEIKSPSSRFRVTGQIDFNSDQADMELVATLPVASNLPWVAALSGALPAAAGLYVASKVFEDQFDKFSSATYEISGPWADPQVKLRRVFDDRLPKKDETVQQKNEAAQQKDAAADRPANVTSPAETAP